MDSKKVNGQSTVVLNTMNSTPSNGHPFDIDWNVEPFHWWFVVRRKLLRFLLSSITYPEGSLTLDVGCGVGSNLAALTSLGYSVSEASRAVATLPSSDLTIEEKIKLALQYFGG